MSTLLQIEDLETTIQTRRKTTYALDGASLTVGAGEIVGLVGESGSGKSMTALSIMRLLPSGGRTTSGRILLDGTDLLDVPSSAMRRIRGKDVAMVFQDPMTSLNPTMTIGAQVAEAVRLHSRLPTAKVRERVLETFELVGLPSPVQQVRRYPHQLSGGLRQRVVIAMAIACRPRLLIADEPTTALDVTIQDQVLQLLESLRSELGMGVLLISHDMGVIARSTSRTVVMYAGRVMETGDTARVLRESRHPYTRSLLEALPRLHGPRRADLYTIPGMPPDLETRIEACPFAPRCHKAADRCRTERPPIEVDASGHRVACFYPEAPTSELDGGRARIDLGAADGQERARSAEVILSVENVVKEYSPKYDILFRRRSALQAVSDVSFQVFEGETLGLVGESGCGKSTLARLIVGLEEPDAGAVRFVHDYSTRTRVGRARERRRNIQLVFQDPDASLDPRMRISQSLREPLDVQRIGLRRARGAAVHRSLKEVSLGERALDQYPHEFSGGQRQRIGIARALSLEPRLIVADEPVSALDASVKSQVLNLMRRIQGNRKLTFVLISHDLSVVRHLADRVAVMYLGKLVEVGPTEQVYASPSHPYTSALLAASLSMDPADHADREHRAIKGDLPSPRNPPSGCRFRTRCPMAQAICAEEEPPLRPVRNAVQLVACHFPLASATPQVDPRRPDAGASRGVEPA